MKLVGTISAASGIKLAVYMDNDRYYTGPAAYIASDLFTSSSPFKAKFRVKFILSRTIFTLSKMYVISPSEEIGLLLRSLPMTDRSEIFCDEIIEGQDAIEWDCTPLNRITDIINISPMPYMNSETDLYYLIMAYRTSILGETDIVYIVKIKEIYDEGEYDIKYFFVPEKVAQLLAKNNFDSINLPILIVPPLGRKTQSL